MKSNKKIKKQNKRKTKKKQFGGAAGTPKFRCKSPNDVNDSELDKFYNNLFKVLLKEGDKNATKKKKITITKQETLDDGSLVKTQEEITENSNNDKITSLQLYNLIKDNNVLFTELMSRYYNR